MRCKDWSINWYDHTKRW